MFAGLHNKSPASQLKLRDNSFGRSQWLCNLSHAAEYMRVCANRTIVTSQMNYHMVWIGWSQVYVCYPVLLCISFYNIILKKAVSWNLVIFFLSCLPQIVEDDDDDGQGVMRIELQREKKGNSQNYQIRIFWQNGLHCFMFILSFQGEGWVLTSGVVKIARMSLGIQVSSSPGSTEKARQQGTGD